MRASRERTLLPLAITALPLLSTERAVRSRQRVFHVAVSMTDTPRGPATARPPGTIAALVPAAARCVVTRRVAGSSSITRLELVM